MKKETTLIIISCALLSTLAHGRDAWKVSSSRIEPSAITASADHLLSVTFLNSQSHDSFNISSPTFMTSLVQMFAVSGNLILLGRGESFDEVIVVDEKSHAIVFRAVGYSIQVLGDRWLVSVEWYPNHVFPPMYPYDVVLIRDLTKQYKQCSQPKAETGEFQKLLKNAGKPIFPHSNLKNCSYENVQQRDDHTYRVDRSSFALLPDNRLVFAASDGSDGSPQQQYLVVADLGISGGEMVKSTSQSLAPTAALVGAEGQGSLQILRIEPVAGDEIKILFPPGAYHTNQVTVHLN